MVSCVRGGATRKTRKPTTRLVLLWIWCITLIGARADVVRADGESDLELLKGISLEATGYFDYSHGRTAGPMDTQADFNAFNMTRGYFTFKKKVTEWMSVRVTMDIHQDESGDYKRRDKYYYAELRPPDTDVLTHMTSEVGIGHMPWLDFEEHINLYRCQGTMAIERAGVFNSADAGVSLRGYLGQPLEDAKSKTGNSHYAGRYGSWHVGVYNGGGYHAAEANENKVIEGRMTLRPLPDHVPGVQVSYFGLYGKGNVAPQLVASVPAALQSVVDSPDYIVHMGMLSFENPIVILTGQVFQTEGNAKGNWIAGTGDALKTMGYSAFANVNIPGGGDRWSLFGRYDHFDADVDDVLADKTAYDMVVGGAAFDLHRGNLVLVAVESTTYEDDFGAKKGSLPAPDTQLGDDVKVQVVYQIKI